MLVNCLFVYLAISYFGRSYVMFVSGPDHCFYLYYSIHGYFALKDEYKNASKSSKHDM